jgi:sulfur carrier protein ThiS
MTHVSIDRQPKAVKEFFESLSLPPEGSVVEMNGRAVANASR